MFICQTDANPADSDYVPLLSLLFSLVNVFILSPCHKWPSAVNYVNLTESRFRSFSALKNTTDLDPVKQKKADVMGLRKSSRGVKPHPFLQHPLHSPHLLQNPPTYPTFKLP